MRLTLPTQWLLVCLLAIASCNSSQTPTTIEPSDRSARSNQGDANQTDALDGEASGTNQQTAAAKRETKDRPKPIASAIAPGEYCYQLSDENQDVDARIVIDSSDRVTGNVQGTIHNEQSSYYSSYRQKLDGTIDGSNLNLDSTTWIELDRQSQQETWKVTSQSLSTERDLLKLASCDTVKAAFQTDGLEAKDLTGEANQVNTREVFFESGASSTTVSNAVIRGDRNVYMLTAQADQQMTLSMSALEDNAVFDVISPSGLILAREATAETLYLPELGEYQIVVGATRGSATYQLAIAIE